MYYDSDLGISIHDHVKRTCAGSIERATRTDLDYKKDCPVNLNVNSNVSGNTYLVYATFLIPYFFR